MSEKKPKRGTPEFLRQMSQSFTGRGDVEEQELQEENAKKPESKKKGKWKKLWNSIGKSGS
jgi:hypothetical protein